MEIVHCADLWWPQKLHKSQIEVEIGGLTVVLGMAMRLFAKDGYLSPCAMLERMQKSY